MQVADETDEDVHAQRDKHWSLWEQSDKHLVLCEQSNKRLGFV
jgi:hypothetical protein